MLRIRYKNLVLLTQVDMEMEQRALERGFDSDQEREEQVRGRWRASQGPAGLPGW